MGGRNSITQPSQIPGPLAAIVNVTLFNMKRLNFLFTIGVTSLIITSCKPTQSGQSMIVGTNYNQQKNETILTVLPYGNIALPGNWIKVSYDKVSKQHFFKNDDSTTIAVTKNPKQQYPFYKSEQSNEDFLSEFTKWESDYFKTQGATINFIEDQSDKGYVLWKASIEKENINTIYLFGLKGDYAYNLLSDSKTWTDEKKKQFLINLFNNN